MSLFLLHPRDLPTTSPLLAQLCAAGSYRDFAALTAPLPGADPLARIREIRLRQALSPFWPGSLAPVPLPARSAAIDRLFSVVRVPTDTPGALGYSILGGYEELLCELSEGGTALLPFEVRRLHLAFTCLLETVASGRLAVRLDREIPSEPAPRRVSFTETGAWQRWSRGHRIFAVLIQGLVVALGCLTSRRPADVEPTAALAITVRLMRAATAALRLAADLPAARYAQWIRPRMAPPHAPPGVSGTWWSDHAYMVTMLRKLWPWLPQLDKSNPSQMMALRRELTMTYAAHRSICAAFVGPSASSLLSASGGIPATTALARLSTSRQRLLNRHGGRLDPSPVGALPKAASQPGESQEPA
jgi:hypothetical protein